MEKIKTFEIGKLYRINETDVPFILVKKGEKRNFERGGGYYDGSVFKIKYEGVEYLTMCDIFYDKDGYEYLRLNVESDYGKTDGIYNWFGCAGWYACDLYEGECSEDDEWEVE